MLRGGATTGTAVNQGYQTLFTGDLPACVLPTTTPTTTTEPTTTTTAPTTSSSTTEPTTTTPGPPTLSKTTAPTTTTTHLGGDQDGLAGTGVNVGARTPPW